MLFIQVNFQRCLICAGKFTKVAPNWRGFTGLIMGIFVNHMKLFRKKGLWTTFAFGFYMLDFVNNFFMIENFFVKVESFFTVETLVGLQILFISMFLFVMFHDGYEI